jgi:exopolysaccharide biosynthesis protein
MNDLTRLIRRYGSIKAANLDGGTSRAMDFKGQIITNPRNGAFAAKTRPVPNAWMLVE